ncbi:MAG: AbrB/MazE/SpoVT family DNA-binding domain-containing protein [Deltaproteobacteria bacterium HGW-Deltaproteobacteria-4]|nr:MAG: AbrB/MazE/SpoVT family DNA-binding domain-containing protein [Deltaproteobacteria bacterium HGW-Deltaproteobacteria-4]
MFAKAQKWGNSLAVRLPKGLAEECGIEADSSIEIVREDNLIIIKSARKEGLSLDSLLAGVTTENLHAEVATGKSVGREQW